MKFFFADFLINHFLLFGVEERDDAPSESQKYLRYFIHQLHIICAITHCSCCGIHAQSESYYFLSILNEIWFSHYFCGRSKFSQILL